MINYDEKVDFIAYCLSEMAVEVNFSRFDNKELIESLYTIITDGELPLLWEYLPIDLQEFYVNAGTNILKFKYDLLENETPYIDNYVDSVTSDLLEIGMVIAQTAMLAMEPMFFAFSYEALNNKIGVCRKLKGSRQWKCQLGALKSARASANGSIGKCRDKPNPVNCERKIKSVIEKLDKNIEKVQEKLKIEINAEKNREKIKAQRELAKRAGANAPMGSTTSSMGSVPSQMGEAMNFDLDSDEDPFQKIKDDLKKGTKDKLTWAKDNKMKAAKNAAAIGAGATASSTGIKLTTNFINTRKALQVAKATEGAANASKAAALGLKTANFAKSAVKFGAVSIAASMLRKAAITVLSRKRMDVCNRNFDGSEKYKCRVDALEGSIRELRKLVSSCGTDKKCKDKLNKALLTAMKQSAEAKVKYDEARVYERNK